MSGMKNESKYNTEALSVQSLVEEPSKAYSLQDFTLIRLSREGVLKKTLLLLAEKLALTMQEISPILHISERTLQRYKNEDVLTPDISERALLLVQLYRNGISVFGTAENFNDWLRTPLPALKRQAPIEYLDTAFGFQLISDELGRIQHGIFS